MRQIDGRTHAGLGKSGIIHCAAAQVWPRTGKAMRRLQLQLVFVLLAAISVATLSAILIVRSVRGAERVVLGDTRRALSGANAELELQYSERVNADSAWVTLPDAARDISLRAVSQITLRAYPGVEGGFSA